MITYYLNKILMPKLRKFGVSNDFCNYTIETIERQITSLLAHWNDIAFRKSILLIGMEEGIFYEPSAKTDIKAFVVVTIRNSPIETMQSDLYSETGLKSPLTDEQIKSITSDAIRYFNAQNFSAFCESIKNTLQDDYYYQILNDYPVAKTALEKLSTTTAKSVIYKPVEFSNPYSLYELTMRSKTENINNTMSAVVLDGYSTELDTELCGILQAFAEQDQGAFVSDSFKFVTRNFKKLIRILEYLLTHNVSFVTPNFYLENGCVERRKNLLKASHSVREMENKITKTADLSFRHKTALKHFQSNS